MKILAIVAVLMIIGAPRNSNAKPIRLLQVGHVVLLKETEPVCWGMSGIPFIYLRTSAGDLSPLTRSEIYDARTSYILSNCAINPLKPQDVRVRTWKGHVFVTVRDIVLAEVLSQDAHSTGMSQKQLANEWANTIRSGLMRVQPNESKRRL